MVATIQTTVFNCTDNDYDLAPDKIIKVSSVSKGSSSIIKCDVNATYREYWVGTAAGIAEVVLTSDDCAECSEIIIVPSGDGRIDFQKTLRESTSDKKKRTCVIQ
ncbi:hypothetical protein M758_11G113500 [Ceratodon purpureus]|nr:hypothetical protein M758_11G113500 [Ceratodon purpureus]